jgi:hypothetical protein
MWFYSFVKLSQKSDGVFQMGERQNKEKIFIYCSLMRENWQRSKPMAHGPKQQQLPQQSAPQLTPRSTPSAKQSAKCSEKIV